MIPAVRSTGSTQYFICVRTLGRERERYVVCGEEREQILSGNHPRVAALALAERLAADRPYNLRECNPWQYDLTVSTPEPRRCRVCGCTDDDCRGCIARTGKPCHWVAVDLCSACIHTPASAVHTPEILHP